MDDSALFSNEPAPEDGHLFSEAPAPSVQSPLESAARGALRNVPLAQQATAGLSEVGNAVGLPTPSYSDELAHLTKAAEEGKAQNPKSYYTGAAAGTLAPLLIPGVGEAAMAARGTGALGGALNAAAQSISDVNLTKPTGSDVANTAISAALGGALGKMFSPKAALSEAAGDVSELAAPKASPGVLESAAPSAIPSPRFGTTHKPVAPDFVNPPDRVSASLIMQGIGGTPRQQLKLYIGKDPVAAANEIGSWMNTADNGKSVVGLLDRPGALLSKTESIHDTSGKVIGDVIDKVSPGATVDSGALAFKIDHLLDETYNQQAEHALTKLQGQLQKADEAGRLDFQALQKIKSGFGKEARAAGHDQSGTKIREAYGVLSQYMNDAVDQFGSHVKDPNLLAAYNKAKLDYKNASNLLPILRYQEVKEMIGGPAGHTTLLGLMEKLVHQGSMAVGVPPPDQLVKNAMLRAGSAMAPSAEQGAAPAARLAMSPTLKNGLSRAAQLELTNALESKFGNKTK